MDWKRERDALIAQTHAFVQLVAGKKEDSVRAAEEEACHTFGQDDNAASVITLLISCIGLGRVAVPIKLKGEWRAAEDSCGPHAYCPVAQGFAAALLAIKSLTVPI